jgi:hypothetical protein
LKDVLTYISDFASIASLIVTIFVAFRVKKIEDGFLRAIRLPDLTGRLHNHATALLDCYNDFDVSKQRILEELAICKSTSRSISEKADGRIRRVSKSILKQIEKYIETGGGKEGLMTLYTNILTLVQDLEDSQEDAKWQAR